MRGLLASYISTLLLTILDVSTTYAVLSAGRGYEVNPVLRGIMGEILPVKVIGITLVYAVVAVTVKNERVLRACALTLPLFYLIIVVNNLGVLLGLFDMRLNLVKMAAIEVAVFIASLGFPRRLLRTP